MNQSKPTPTPSSFIGRLPDDVFKHVAGFLGPVDIVHLIDEIPDIKSCQTHLSNIGTSPHTSQCLGDALLYEAQWWALMDVLHNGPAKLPYESIVALIQLQRRLPMSDNYLLLSGSTMVQVLTGKRFDSSDIDLYVNSWGVPEVRETLKSMGFICHRVTCNYNGKNFEDNTEGIHHVEAWCLPTNIYGTNIETLTARQLSSRYQEASFAAQEDRWEEVDNQWTIPFLFRGHTLERMLGPYSFDPDIPFTLDPNDSTVVKVIDLVVSNHGINPQAIINNFDIEICKATFNGKQFLNPNGKLTYQNRSQWNDDWGNFINDYIPAFFPQVHNPAHHPIPLMAITSPLDYYSNWTHGRLFWIMNAFCKAVHSDGGKMPCIRHGFSCHCSQEIIARRFYNNLHRAIIKRFNRILKYISREIELPLNDAIRQAFFAPPPELDTASCENEEPEAPRRSPRRKRTLSTTLSTPPPPGRRHAY